MRPRALVAGFTLVCCVTGCHAAGTSGASPSASASASVAVPLVGVVTVAPVGPPKGAIAVASAGFTESAVLAALYTGLLTRAGWTVTLTSVPETDTLQTSLEQKTGGVDVVPEYAASYADQLHALVHPGSTASVGSADLKATMAELTALAAARGIALLTPTAAVDTYAFAVRTKFATANNLTSLSDLGRLGVPVSLAADDACATRPTCQPGLLRTYGIKISSLDPLGVDTASGINAVVGHRDTMVLVRTTDAAAAAAKLTVLTDDKSLQDADNVLPAVNATFLTLNPDVATTLNQLAGVLTTADLTMMNEQVDVGLQDPQNVANAWLKSKGLA